MAQREAASDFMARCKMGKDTSQCAAMASKISGVTRPTDVTKAANLDKREAEKGAADAVGNKMQECKRAVEAKTKTEKDCMAEAKADMEKLKGRTIKEEELAFDLKEAGKKKAGDFLKNCTSQATTNEDKAKCLDSPEAKKAMAEAMGKNLADIKKEDLIR